MSSKVRHPPLIGIGPSFFVKYGPKMRMLSAGFWPKRDIGAKLVYRTDWLFWPE
jgi:hypothetical protein